MHAAPPPPPPLLPLPPVKLGDEAAPRPGTPMAALESPAPETPLAHAAPPAPLPPAPLAAPPPSAPEAVELAHCVGCDGRDGAVWRLGDLPGCLCTAHTECAFRLRAGSLKSRRRCAGCQERARCLDAGFAYDEECVVCLRRDGRLDRFSTLPGCTCLAHRACAEAMRFYLVEPLVRCKHCEAWLHFLTASALAAPPAPSAPSAPSVSSGKRKRAERLCGTPEVARGRICRLPLGHLGACHFGEA